MWVVKRIIIRSEAVVGWACRNWKNDKFVRSWLDIFVRRYVWSIANGAERTGEGCPLRRGSADCHTTGDFDHLKSCSISRSPLVILARPVSKPLIGLAGSFQVVIGSTTRKFEFVTKLGSKKTVGSHMETWPGVGIPSYLIAAPNRLRDFHALSGSESHDHKVRIAKAIEIDKPVRRLYPSVVSARMPVTARAALRQVEKRFCNCA